MMPAAKHGDPQVGVDIHLCMVPMPAPTPTPLPTPHMSVVFDPMDYVPFIGATITVCGMKRATAGTTGQVVHIPPGFPFAPKPPEKDDELFMGSATIVADGDPMSHIAHPVLSCNVAGMPSPFRLKKKGGPRACLLPTVFNLAIPSTVFLGGPPTINLMGMAMKAGFAALGKFAKSKMFKKARHWLADKLGAKKPSFLRCVILKAEPVCILDGSVIVEQEDFSLPGRLPIEWIRSYRSSATDEIGLCGPGWETLADTRLTVDPEEGHVLVHGPDFGVMAFDRLPIAKGANASELELMDGSRLIDDGAELRVETKDDRIYHFPKQFATRGTNGHWRLKIGRISDRCGSSLDFEYRDGQIAAINESAGRRLLLTVEHSRLYAVTLSDPDSGFSHVFVRYQYDLDGDLVAVIDALGNPYRFAYDDHHLTCHTDRNGLSFYYEYDKQATEGWRVLHAWGDGGLYNYHFNYLDALNERRIINSQGHVSVIKLSESGLPISEIDPLGGITIYEYDNAGRTTAVIDPAGLRTAYEFDDNGNLLILTRPDGLAVLTAYDDHDLPVLITDPGGAEWQMHWDCRGMLIKEISPQGHIDCYEYDDRGQLSAHVNPLGARTAFRYDALGLPSQVTDENGISSHMEHDSLGNLTAETDKLGRKTIYQSDPKGQTVGVTLPSAASIHCRYDPEGNLTEYIDEIGAVTRFEYFGQGQVSRRHQPDGHIVEYHYDSEEQLVGIRNQRGEIYQLKRDALGQIIEEIDFNGLSRHYVFNKSGLLASCLDALHRRIDYTYDSLGNLIKQVLPDPNENDKALIECFAYDANGNMLETSNAQVKVTREFDEDGQLISELQSHKSGRYFRVENSYDAAGNRIGRKTTNSNGPGHQVFYRHDTSSQLAEIQIDETGSIRIKRDPAGRIIHETIAPDLSRQMQYNDADLLTDQVIARNGLTFIATHYNYDAVGNLCQRYDKTNGRDVFTYDSMGQIRIHQDRLGELKRFLIDPAGDRLKQRPEWSNAEVGHYAQTDRPWVSEKEYEGTLYRFDVAGCLIQKIGLDREYLYTWDANQRLIASRQIQGGQSKLTSYAYDPLGRRLYKETEGVQTWFGWDEDCIAYDAVDRQNREFLFYPESFEPLAMLTERELIFVNEPNGSPTRLVGSVIEWEGHFNSLGGIDRLDTDQVDNPIRLQGQYADPESGLYYNYHRYFDPEISQFVSCDPLGLLGGLAAYAYSPNIFSWIDPFGLVKCKPKQTYAQWIKSKKSAPKTHVYIGYRGKKPVYVGITNDLRARAGQHGSRFKLVKITKNPINRGHARSIEQAIIEMRPGFENTINSIARNRPIFKDAVKYGKKWVKSTKVNF
jgi:RHS repeat-associated protein